MLAASPFATSRFARSAGRRWKLAPISRRMCRAEVLRAAVGTRDAVNGANMATTVEPCRQIGYQRSMVTLFHHPFCPHSRFVRLILGEYGLETRLIEERAWERRHDFLALNPAGTTPVLIAEGQPPIPGASVIAEYLDEAYGRELGDRRLMPGDIDERVEVRRLMGWFNDKFFAEVSGPVNN